MKHANLLAVLLLFIAGCDAATRIESNSSPVPVANDQNIDTPTLETGITAESPKQFVFSLSEAATTKARATMASVPGGTHLVVFVDVDEKYCTGFHYNLQVEANPSKSRFAMTESNGIKLAIEKDDVKFLNGTTLDYATLASGTEGFVFRNPNENVSLRDELREGQPSENKPKTAN